ncbi:TolC family protein [Sulfuriflexus sp.]|uniref:TolC family protein n=1 Tax=Sulfuriflexus sp. TaxID=2015443 RepID=UPI0028CC6CCD|nr:TolC family protein [Sulfuriflexus sp.]MDT8403086.1 TolC family protein [Sulfuriflexus sp.]
MFTNRTRCLRLYQLISLLIAIGLMANSLPAHADVLSLEEAEQLAIQGDPMLGNIDATAQALDEAAIADGQLPDPKAKVSLFNFPTDTFDRKQEPMAQLRFGVQQAIPRGDTLELRNQRTRVQAGGERARVADETRKLRRDVRANWYETFYWRRAERIVAANKRLFSEMLDITESQYAAGRRNQQDVLRADLELGLLEDRLTDIRQKQETARAALAKWLGADAQRELPDDIPRLPEPPSLARLQASLPQHPALRIQQAHIDTNRKNVSLAREAYKPAWTVGIDYGARNGNNMDGSERADLLAATVTFDLPIFTNKRQDRRLAAAQHREGAARLQYDDRLRAMQSQLEKEYVTWQRLSQRLQRYRQTLIGQATANSEASLLAYQNDATDFPTLMRAKITELETHLKAMRIHVDAAKAQARLLYLAGEE